ncbi:RDD family protein [Corynebacterium comes]|uniref:RDD family protein n=1 Tax=Corynebacterium comes TaxID=2675218 RepID=A0A6B8VLT8_9CORY|nr:RDD family protein [Corynebacterium comes]QGU04029.1 RDD family protein [Corynebacterium comes]
MSSCLTRRLIAFLIDVALAYVLFFAAAWLWPAWAEPVGVDPAPLLLLITFAVRALPELVWRRSPGKMILRLDAVGPRWAPLVRHSWLWLPVPLALALPAVPWYSILAIVLGLSAVLAPDGRSGADRLARTTVIARGRGCALPG